LKKARGTRERSPIAQQLVAQFKAAIPSNDVITGRALHDVLAPYGGDVEQIKSNVSRIIADSEARAYQLYKDAQSPALSHALRTVFTSLLRGSYAPAAGFEGVAEGSGRAELINMLAENADALDAFFLSVSQGRKARAGSAVETFFDTLFHGMGYPFEREHVVNGTPDFVFPNVAHFRKHATDCIIFTSKRTLRERWRQITSEGSRGFVLFLGTLDATIKPADLNEMKRQKINLVVPEHIRGAAYESVPNVMSVEGFLRDHLDPSMDRWHRHGVIR
jgi:hypothetical protein